ncbi:MAG: cell division protein ZapB [bacterium]|jgi:FtsZ-binding cell division protein ZapB|nr:cell division protein ZapB [bacterium]
MTMENLLEVLEALDRKVESLVTLVRKLDAERSELRRQLDHAVREKEQMAQERESLLQDMTSFEENRAAIRARVQSIIQKINELEE